MHGKNEDPQHIDWNRIEIEEAELKLGFHLCDRVCGSA